MRLMASPLPEARAYGEMILGELKQVIPSFVARLDRPERGGEWIEYLRERRGAADAVVARLGLDRRGGRRRPDRRAPARGRHRGRRDCLVPVRVGGHGRGRDPRPDRRARARGAHRADRRAHRRAPQPPSPSRTRLGGGALPLRDRLRLRRLSRPPAPPPPDLPVAAAEPRPRRRRAGGARRRGRRRASTSAASSCRGPSSSGSRVPVCGTRLLTPYASATGSATCST